MRLSTRRLVSFAVCLGFSSLLASAVLAQPDPQVGLWKLNVAKSKYAPGPAPKSGTTRIEAVGAGTKVVVDQVAGDGAVRHWEYTAKYDGKDTIVTGNNPDADTIARTRINANTVQTISKKDGKVTTTQSSVVSSDGKTRTVTTKGTAASGQQINRVAVYDRQ